MRDNTHGAFIIGINEKWERVAASASRISTQKGDAIEVFEKTSDSEANRRSIKKVLSSGHSSILEHIVFNIAFCNVSAVVEQFMIEFRLASFMVKSRRYVDFSDAGYYIPESFDGEIKQKYIGHMNFLFGEYAHFEIAGVPKEDARFLLPYSFFTNFYCTVNARELLLILRRMLYWAGEYVTELKNLGEQLLSQLREICPVVSDEFYIDRSEYMSGAPMNLPVFDYGTVPSDFGRVDLISYPKNEDEILSLVMKIKGEEYTKGADFVNKPRTRELEHLVYTFIFRGISLSGITHMARHRMQSLIVPQLMNVDPGRHVVPETVSGDPMLNDRYEEAFSKNIEAIKNLTALGINKNELAYLRLAGNVADTLSTVNARELSVFFKLRMCNRAQWEIRNFADSLHARLIEISPDIFKRMGPSCYTEGFCPEGRLTCGNPRKF